MNLIVDIVDVNSIPNCGRNISCNRYHIKDTAFRLTDPFRYLI